MPTELEQQSILVSTAPAPKPQVHPLDFAVAVARAKKRIFLTTTVAVLLGAILSFVIPSVYTANTRIFVPQQNQSPSSLLLGQLGSLASLAGAGTGLGTGNSGELYVTLLRSRTAADALIGRFDLMHVYKKRRMEDTRVELGRNSEINLDKDGTILIEVDDRNAKRAADLADAYVEELRKLNQQLALSEASQRRLFFENQLQQAKEDLANAEVQMKETEQKTGMFQLDAQAKALIEQIGMLRAQIANKEVQLQAMRSFATQENPDYVLIRQEIAGLKTQLASMENEQSQQQGDPIMATNKVPGLALDYVRRLREVKYREALFDLLAKQYEAAKLDEAKHGATIQVIDEALVPEKRSRPKRIEILIEAALVGFFGALFWIFLKEMSLRADPEQAAKLEIFCDQLLGTRRRFFSKHI